MSPIQDHISQLHTTLDELPETQIAEEIEILLVSQLTSKLGNQAGGE